MIVNDREGKKTIDTESGVWLNNAENFSREHMAGFLVFDGTKKLSFWTIKLSYENEPGGSDTSYRLYEAPFFFDAPARRGYREIIQALLEHFGLYYGYAAGREAEMRCKAIMGPAFLTALDAWENGDFPVW